MENKILYSILFLKGRNGTDAKELASILSMKEPEVRQKLRDLQEEIKKLNLPLEVKETETKFRLTINKETSIELSEVMNKTINVSLTKSLLEALTVIAYKQPTTKSNIESIRGVSADYAISKLLEYELIESNERADLPGKPRLYVTTTTFLELFDLNTLNDLPEVSTEFKEQTQETTLFTYDDDEEGKLIREVEMVKNAPMVEETIDEEASDNNTEEKTVNEEETSETNNDEDNSETIVKVEE